MSIEAMKRIKSLLQDGDKIDSHTISAVVAECDAVILAQQPATGEPVARVDYSERGNIAWLFGPQLPDGTELFKRPAPSVPGDVRIAGQALANIAFNLAQNTGQKIEKRWADSMREAYKAWDAARLTAAQAQKGGA